MNNVIFHCGANHARRIYLLIMGTPNVSYRTNFGRYTETPPLKLGFYRLFQPPYEEPSVHQAREIVMKGIKRMHDIEFLTSVVAPDETFVFETPSELTELMKQVNIDKESLQKVEQQIQETQALLEVEHPPSLNKDELELANMQRKLIQLQQNMNQTQKLFHQDRIKKREQYAETFIAGKQKIAYAQHLFKMKELFLLHILINEFPNQCVTRNVIGAMISIGFKNKNHFNAENLAFMTPNGLHKLVRNLTNVLTIFQPKGLTFGGNMLKGIKQLGFEDSDVHALLNAKSYNLDEREKDTAGKVGKILRGVMGLS